MLKAGNAVLRMPMQAQDLTWKVRVLPVKSTSKGC